MVAADVADLANCTKGTSGTDCLLAQIDLDINGKEVDAQTWTGTLPDGTSDSSELQRLDLGLGQRYGRRRRYVGPRRGVDDRLPGPVRSASSSDLLPHPIRMNAGWRAWA